ncbi:Hypothetical predicted protein [Mytilus galloprovincialis]|uniref:CCHC-type domain-containing protein n=1 Tax=Mytilus galloprovincialis TaxID=29158 RepID=A0A8B6GU72_MYTGA|nr:Hypothetical predicted protein [Mytilus galloprovincialis]
MTRKDYVKLKSRALKTIKEKKGRTKPYTKPSATVSRPPTNTTDMSHQQYNQPFRRNSRREATSYDMCYECHQFGHWRTNCPNRSRSNLQQETTQPHKIKDKYLNLVDEYLLHGHMNILLEHVKYFDKVDFSKLAKGVKSSLSKNVAFWEHIGASSYFIDTIKSGYMIPFVSLPPL